MAWRAAKLSLQRLAPERPVSGVAGDRAGRPGKRVVTGCTVPCSPAAPQPLSTGVQEQMQRGRGLRSLGAAELGFSTLGFVSHFLYSGEPVSVKLSEPPASRGLI